MSIPGALLSSPIADQLLVGIYSASKKRIGTVLSLVYRAQFEGHIDENEAAELQAAADHRRKVLAARRRLGTKPQKPTWLRMDHREERAAKRRTWSASGALPPKLRCNFTPGENAVAAVIRSEVRRHGFCSLPYSRIAASAGLRSVTVVKRFIRRARATGLIKVTERPVVGSRNKPNIITITSPDWKSWNTLAPREGGGGTNVPPNQNTRYYKALSSPQAARKAMENEPMAASEKKKGAWKGSEREPPGRLRPRKSQHNG